MPEKVIVNLSKYLITAYLMHGQISIDYFTTINLKYYSYSQNKWLKSLTWNWKIVKIGLSSMNRFLTTFITAWVVPTASILNRHNLLSRIYRNIKFWVVWLYQRLLFWRIYLLICSPDDFHEFDMNVFLSFPNGKTTSEILTSFKTKCINKLSPVLLELWPVTPFTRLLQWIWEFKIICSEFKNSQSIRDIFV